jgi:hypothetical protein
MDRANTFSDLHLDALKLEVDLIDKLMTRNRCSHGKAKYFRLLAMACASLRKSNVLELFDEVTGLLQDIPAMCKSYKTKRKRQEIFWDFQLSEEKSEMKENDLHQLSQRIDQVANCVACQLPVCLSKFVYASKFYFLEISRGFFLPFCVVTIGAIARIRTLLEQLGRFVLQECWYKLESSWQEFRDLHGAEKCALIAGTSYKEELEKARSTFAVSLEPVDYNNTLSKVDRAIAILHNLGIHMALSKKNKMGNKSMNSTSGIFNDFSGEINLAKEDRCDRGEVIVAAHASGFADTKEIASLEKSPSSSALRVESESVRVDRNSEILEKLKGKKVKEKRHVVSAVDSSKPKKKRKEKSGKKGMGDFFDELFSR